VSDPQQPIPQPDPVPQPAPEPAPEPAPPAPQDDSNLKTRGPLLLESTSAARLGPPNSGGMPLRPSRIFQLCSFAHFAAWERSL
jgi:hypothetical protein